MSDGRLSEHDIQVTRQIAALRIRVERAIKRVKSFKILSGNIPNENVLCCAMLTNMHGYLLDPVTTISDLSEALSSCTSPQTTCSSILTSPQSQLQLSPSSVHENGGVPSPTSVHQNLHITHELQSLVELNTKKQRECPLRYQLRSCQITSSNFGLIVKRKTKFENFAKQLSCTKQFSNCKVPSLLWGIQNEDIARQLYIKNLRKSDPTFVMDYSAWT